MSEPCTVACPYCNRLVVESFEEGYGVRVCSDCMQPFLVRNRWIPDCATLKVEGCIEVLPHSTPEEINQDIHEDPEQILCADCGKPISPDSDWRLCEDCLKDDEPEQGTANSAFLNCPLSKNSLYRLDGDYVEVKYKKGAAIKTTWSDIHMLCEEENPTSTIKELLGERANTNNVAAVNAFVRAVKVGLIEVDA